MPINISKILTIFSSFSVRFLQSTINLLAFFLLRHINRFGKYSHPHYTAIDISTLVEHINFPHLAERH